jgi:hypothetical protein
MKAYDELVGLLSLILNANKKICDSSRVTGKPEVGGIGQLISTSVPKSTFISELMRVIRKAVSGMLMGRINGCYIRVEQQHSALTASEKRAYLAIYQDENCWTIAGLCAANEGFQRK